MQNTGGAIDAIYPNWLNEGPEKVFLQTYKGLQLIAVLIYEYIFTRL
jgi:hypothetical protein